MATSPSNPKPTRRGMSLAAKCVLWTAVSLLSGVLGGAACQWFTKDVPFYFGFFFTWTLVGLTGLFVLAVHVGLEMERTHQERRAEMLRRYEQGVKHEA